MAEPVRHDIFRSMAALGLVAVFGTALLTGIHRLTEERIDAQERRVVLEQLGQIMPADRYDNVMQDDLVRFTAEQHFPRGQVVTAYRARLRGEPIAVLLRHRAVDGYNGDIDLLTGILADGRLAGVRVTGHKETPGLGDGIELEKDDWILGFDGKSLENPVNDGWKVKRDGGEFDGFTGATITPRAVVGAVHAALEYFSLNREQLFRPVQRQEEPR
jgi:electron transport complex protein RnfG